MRPRGVPVRRPPLLGGYRRSARLGAGSVRPAPAAEGGGLPNATGRRPRQTQTRVGCFDLDTGGAGPGDSAEERGVSSGPHPGRSLAPLLASLRGLCGSGWLALLPAPPAAGPACPAGAATACAKTEAAKAAPVLTAPGRFLAGVGRDIIGHGSFKGRAITLGGIGALSLLYCCGCASTWGLDISATTILLQSRARRPEHAPKRFVPGPQQVPGGRTSPCALASSITTLGALPDAAAPM
mmetsp:Transcript_112526/g.318751  ORF Transcript_112526/g.318751 Transcript_112526/m.318751 type:complete len:239 (+) Transcript_112526:178-894(+)